MPASPMHLLCTLAGAPVGFPAGAVREVVPLPLIVPLSHPRRPGGVLVLGAVNLRGQLTPVLDLCAALELPFFSPSPRDNLVVLEGEGRQVCVRVSRVRDVQTLLSPQHFEGELLEGIARSGDQIVRLLRVETLFDSFNFAPALAGGAAVDAAPLDLWTDLQEGERETLQSRAVSLAKPLEVVAPGIMTSGGEAKLWAAIRWGSELFGLDLEFVREFAPIRTLAPVPLGPPHVLGLMNLRGEILPVLDLREIAGAGAPNSTPPTYSLETINLGEKGATRGASSSASALTTASALVKEPPLRTAMGKSAGAREPERENAQTIIMQIVVIEHAGTRLGVRVDEVVDVFAVSPGQIQSASGTSREESELLHGSVPFGNRRLGLLDLSKTLKKSAALEGR